MKFAKNINCDSTSGTNIEDRICLNIELRAIDSLMLLKFNTLLKEINKDNFVKNKDSLVRIFKEQQSTWESKRKSVSLYKSDGFTANTEAIVYMQSMIFFTRLRINEIEYIQQLY
jgi:uncharacterized protein